MSARKWKHVIGDEMCLVYRYQGRVEELRLSAEGQSIKKASADSATLGEKRVPKWIELNTSGGAGPDTRVRVEIRDGSPEVVEIAWVSRPGQLDIRQKDLRAINLADLAVDLYTSSGALPFPEGADGSPPTDDQITQWAKETRKRRLESRNFLERQRRPRERRVMTDEFLESVADVYRANVHKRAPTQAVAKEFNVEIRMASTYVRKARERDFLPKTRRGKKQA
jgi:hypothetical protein